MYKPSFYLTIDPGMIYFRAVAAFSRTVYRFLDLHWNCSVTPCKSRGHIHSAAMASQKARLFFKGNLPTSFTTHFSNACENDQIVF